MGLEQEQAVGDIFISILQGAELNRVLREIEAKSTFEIGFAFGYSTIWILDAVARHRDGKHEAIDPFEKSNFSGVGLKQVSETGNFRSHFVWHEDFAIQKISEFIRQKRLFDAAFIDGNHRFDDVIVDFYLADQVIRPGGIIAFDDMWMDSIKSATSFILANRDYKLVETEEHNMLVMQKIDHDKRPWDHYVKFDVHPSDVKENKSFLHKLRASR